MNPTASKLSKLPYYPILGAAIYLLLGLLWIEFSDVFLASIVSDPVLLTRYQTYKGFVYVLLTAILAWVLLKQRLQFEMALVESQRLSHMAFDYAATGIAYVDVNGQFIKVNQELCRMLEYSADELRSMTFQHITHPDDLLLDQGLREKILANDIKQFSIEKRYITKNNHTLWVRLSVALLPPQQHLSAYFISVMQDISAIKHAQHQLQESEQRFRTLLDSMPNISVQGYDEHGVTLYWNKGSELVYGYSKQEALGRNLLDLIIPQPMHNDVKAAIQTMTHSGQPLPPEELQLQRKDGSLVSVYSSHAVIFDPDNKPRIYCIDIDLTERKQQEAQLAFLAEYDPLTHLPNRQFFTGRLEQAIKVARREKLQLAVLIIDLDNFKTINDSYGHSVGNLLLKNVSEKLKIFCRDTDSLARLGGDEFAILIEHLPHTEDAARFALELLQALQQPATLTERIDVTITASIGISLYPEHHNNAESLLQGADAALYKAKAEGRSTYSFFSSQLTSTARQRLQLETKLRLAISQQQLQCYFQPQIAIQSGQIIGAELLIRWQDAEQGFISPELFIPVAENCGLIHIIGHFVLEQACLLGKQWLEEGLPQVRLAVNVSAHQFSKGDFEQQVISTLLATGFPAHLLELEVTETALMHNKDAAIRTMQQLRAAGIRLAIDDFGTGYSSLAYLQRLPLDILKVDRSFIDNITDNDDDRQISKAIIELAHTLHFDVLAEGVETAEQLALLKEMACDYYQGYYFSQAVPAEQFRQLLLNQSPHA
ncbi:EAL domain-containing protein [Rheinheimera sp. UJ51]|uniref:sensor domain-containing protein n=1 Tax=Rheinheimera sp. UJ51 TaxID=2892446 RepID=UPI001E601054|nr:bifunctional diguanylate cyclase/phosphodiesterase [Rheinheimera sp. UJ51]MCC5452403.1 EAL domain-containing protein [Rheinheimera sp. UJ51]